MVEEREEEEEGKAGKATSYSTGPVGMTVSKMPVRLTAVDAIVRPQGKGRRSAPAPGVQVLLQTPVQSCPGKEGEKRGEREEYNETLSMVCSLS